MNSKFVLLVAVVAIASCQQADKDQDTMSPVVWENKRLVVDDALIDKDDVHSVVDPVWWTANIYDGVEAYERSLSSFSKPQRLVFAIVWYRSEVNNGGHDQFYYNSTGIVWRDALEAFQALGLDSFAEILNESASRFTSPPSLDRDTRNNQLDADEPQFDDLDSRFYSLEESANLDGTLMDYVKKHRSDFYFDGSVSIPK